MSIFSDARQNKGKVLTEKDVPMIRHECIKVYGWDWWNTVGLGELFEQLPLVMEDKNKKESLRLCSLKFYGVKNPE